MDAEKAERDLFNWITQAALVAGLAFIAYATFNAVSEKRERQARMAEVEERTERALGPAALEIRRAMLRQARDTP